MHLYLERYAKLKEINLDFFFKFNENSIVKINVSIKTNFYMRSAVEEKRFN